MTVVLPHRLSLTLAGCALVAASAPAQLSQPEVLAFARKWCAECHAPPEPEADLDLIGLLSGPIGGDRLADVLEMAKQLEAGDMPPDDAPWPPRKDVDAVLAWTDAVLAAAGAEPGEAAPPGRVTVRRLTRVEYDNSVRDLLGVRTELSADFPRADLSYGFDNIGDGASFSTLHLEKYAAAAADVAAKAIVREDPDHPTVRHFEGESMASSLGDPRQSGEFGLLISNGHLSERTELPREGDYLIRTRVCGQQAGGEPARMGLRVDGRIVEAVDVPQTTREPLTHEYRVRLPRGSPLVGIAFTNDYYRPDDPDPKNRDRNLLVDWVEVVGPVDPPPLPLGHRWLLGARPNVETTGARARTVVTEMLARLWRRPPSEAEVARSAQIVTSVDVTFEEGVRLALQAALTSPHFLLRLEPGAPDSTEPIERLEAYALASRLSFFLWSSTPDDRLLELARTGDLAQPATLVTEASRLLEDPRASALSENFAAQWLEIRRLPEVQPDPERFATFTSALRGDMQRETELLFESVVREKRSVLELLSADYTFVNERLAEHYGIEGVSGEHFRRVRVLDPMRRGLLGHASIQTITSHPTRTSPVRRGKWILDQLLDDPPPPPPPGTDSFSEDEVGHLLTLREKLAVHRANADCAVCHNRMDTLGLAMENFDPIGRWRREDAGGPIDASGALPNGRRIDGPAELREVLEQGHAFVRCLLTKLFVYGIGRAAGPADQVAIDGMVRALPAQPTFEDLVVGLVQLGAFNSRQPAR